MSRSAVFIDSLPADVQADIANARRKGRAEIVELTLDEERSCRACDRNADTPHDWDTYVSSRQWVSEMEYGDWEIDND